MMHNKSNKNIKGKKVSGAAFALIAAIILIACFSKSPKVSESAGAQATDAPVLITEEKETTDKKVFSSTSEATTVVQSTDAAKSTKADITSATKAEASTKKNPTASKETTTLDPEAKVTVYITKTGEKYHHENPCGNGKYFKTTLAEAKRSGYKPCEKCVLH